MQKPGLFGMNGVLILLLTAVSVGTRAQQSGSLILIDAENKQAFTVRLGDELYASSGHGHLVLSHLKDSSYRLNLRFPKKNIPEQVFPVTVRQKDLGFQLKGADTTWLLYNWQSRETIHPVYDRDSSRILDRGVKRVDGFSQLMAAVVNDTSVMYNTYTAPAFHTDSVQVKPAVPGEKPDSLSPLPVTAPVLAAAGAVRVTAEEKKRLRDSITAVNKAAAAARKDSIATARKLAVASRDSLLAAEKAVKAATRDSLQLADNKARLPVGQPVTGGSPPSGTTGQAGRGTPEAVVQPAVSGGLPATVMVPHGTAKPGVKKIREVSLKISRKIVFLDTGNDGLTDTVTVFVYFETGDSLAKKQGAPAPVLVKKLSGQDSSQSSIAVKNRPVTKTGAAACVQQATDADLESLRSAILIANSEQEKIAVASGAFAMKCFTVAQVRVLAGLFVSDKSKYHLMDAARLHIADGDHFRELADMYTDKNFQKKFLQMADRRS